MTSAGEYSFVLEKGIEYTFGTWPFNEDVDYWMQDDLGPDAPMEMDFLWTGGGVWSIDGGQTSLSQAPSSIKDGWECGWGQPESNKGLPTIQIACPSASSN